MARMARVVVPGVAHHVTQRGNLRAEVFCSDADRVLYLELLAECAARFGMDVWAYCLMSNHVHLIVVGCEQTSLSKALGMAHQRYASWFNVRHGWTGHLWANRFFSAPLDASYQWTAVRYVELNPVRAGLVERAEDWAWSSAAAHCGRRAERDCVLAQSRPFPGPVPDWAAWLARGLGEDDAVRIRRATYTGRPCGGEAFVRQMEALTGRCLAPRKRGRKPKSVECVPTEDLFGDK